MGFAFVKYHGAGNDFILIDDRSCLFPCADAKLIARLCHRQFGIGADGLLLIQPSNTCDVSMRIFNSDGKEAKMCGNGLRCVAHFLGQESLTIETPEKMVTAKMADGRVTVDLGVFEWLKGFEWETYNIHLVNTGVPHAVVFVSGLQQLNFVDIARKIRLHPQLQPEGANVNFVEIQGDRFFVRTYERGVENETLACGTGNAAVAIAVSKIHRIPNPIACIPMSGEILEIDVGQSTVSVTGPATFVFKGTIDIVC
jgi:diaminopimelate epimerase